jgi:tRNA (cytidine32/uridine32-2'-O)-methyltransferase
MRYPCDKCMADRSENIAPAFLSHLRIVLIEPKTPGNIGATARAMRTMGLSRLVLVNPVEFRTVPETRWMAHGAEDLIDNAVVVPSVDEALADMTYVVGTTNRARGVWLNPIYNIDQAAATIAGHVQKHTVAVLFGREDRGLLNHELQRCNLIVRIPAAMTYPSLNLSQAVMVIAYEIFQACMAPPEPVQLRLSKNEDIERICRRIMDTMLRIGFAPCPDEDTFLRSVRRVLRRSLQLEHRDVATLHKLCAEIDAYVGRRGGQGNSESTDQRNNETTIQ